MKTCSNTSATKAFRGGRLMVASLAAAFSLGHLAHAQDEDVFELSPFTVDASEDTGYRAVNTLSGSRLNTSLRDTPASVSVFTQEFLDDTGFQDIQDLTKYSVGSVNNTQEINSGPNINNFISGANSVRRVRIRGVRATKGLNYFEAIIPDDAYRSGRYDESRGPNGLLFGISNAGGILNSSSILANTNRDSGKIKYTTGSNGQSRTEGNFNKVLLDDVLGITLAGVTQDDGGWRSYSSDKRNRVYGAVTWNVSERITVRAMGEKGNHNKVTVRPYGATDEVMAWYNNRELLGVDAVTAIPDGNNASNDQQALGITNRLTTSSSRYVYNANDGSLFNGSRTLITGSYDDKDVAPVPGSLVESGVEANYPAKLDDPDFYPYYLNAGGPGMLNETDFSMYTISADFIISENLVANLAHNFQETDINAPYVSGSEPRLQGDPNITIGNNGSDTLDEDSVLNPYAGRLYFDSNWLKGDHQADYKETRLSLSYDLDLQDSGFGFGRHRIAAGASRRNVSDTNIRWRYNFLGAPFHKNHDNANNRIAVRNYIDEGDFDTYVVAQPPVEGTTVVDANGDTQTLGWVRSVAGTGNASSIQEIDSTLAVMQSYFFDDKLVGTFGYRKDEAENTSFGHDRTGDSERGHLLTRDPEAQGFAQAEFAGNSRAYGLVYHALPQVSLIANYATSIGLPEFKTKTLPNAAIGPPIKGEGKDFGVAFELLDNRISGRLVYFETEEVNRSSSGGVTRRLRDPNVDSMDAFTEIFDDLRKADGSVYTAAEWEQEVAELAPDYNAALENNVSSGYELSLTANLTQNWRLLFNASHTDRIASNYAHVASDWLGWKTGDDGLLVNGITFTEDGSDLGVWSVDKSVYVEGSPVYRILEIAENAVGWDAGTIITENNEESVAETHYLQQFETQEQITLKSKRWGLSPYKANLFTSYDFTEGMLDGFTVGGGYRWVSPSVIGENLSGDEIKGDETSNFDLLLRYRQDLERGALTYQINVYNLLNDKDLIPVRHTILSDATSPLARYSFPEPRSLRASVTYSF